MHKLEGTQRFPPNEFDRESVPFSVLVFISVGLHSCTDRKGEILSLLNSGLNLFLNLSSTARPAWSPSIWLESWYLYVSGVQSVRAPRRS